MPIKKPGEHLLFFFIGLSAIFFYSYIIYRHAINMPKWDDFPDILRFMDLWLQAEGIREKASVFLYHTNEHILLVNHLFILAQYYLLGHIDFRWLIYTGNLFYLGTALLLWLPFKNREESSFAFAVLMLTAVTFYAHESTLWAMTALSNQAVIFFSLLTLWYATRPIPSLGRIISCTLLAVFSQSNGLLLLPLISLIFFLSHKNKLPAWLIFSALLVTLYATLLNPASHQGTEIDWTKIPVQHYLMTLPAFIASFGSTVFNEATITTLIFAFLSGLFVLFFSLKQLLKPAYPPFIFYALIFFILCLASIAFYRGLAGPSVIFTSRYKMYGIYFLSLGLLLSPQWLAHCKQVPLQRYGLLLFCAVFYLASFYLNLPRSILINGHLRESLEHWVEDGDFRRGKGYFIHDSDSYLFAALHRNVWSPLSLIPPERIIGDITLLEACPAGHDIESTNISPLLRIKHINRNAPGIRVELHPETTVEGNTLLFYLCSQDAHYQLRLIPWRESGGLYPVYYIPAAQIAPGPYQIYLEQGGIIRFTHQSLSIKPRTR